MRNNPQQSYSVSVSNNSDTNDSTASNFSAKNVIDRWYKPDISKNRIEKQVADDRAMVRLSKKWKNVFTTNLYKLNQVS